MSNPRPVVTTLPTLMERIFSGELRLPHLQLGPAWSLQQRLDLMDSIRLGLPTGSLLELRTSLPLRPRESIGPCRLEASRYDADRFKNYLIDGQQRLTTLFSVLGPAMWSLKEQAPRLDPTHRRDPEGRSWRIAYDLDRACFVEVDLPGEDRPVWDACALEGEGGLLLPMDIIFDEFAYDEWRANKKPERVHLNRARALRIAFVGHDVPVISLFTDDLSLIRRAVARANCSRAPWADVELLGALAVREDFGLDELIADIREQSASIGDWRAIEADDLLRLIATVQGLDPIAYDLEEMGKKFAEDTDIAAQVTALIHETAAVLQALGIAHPRMLPYRWALILLAQVLHELGGATLSAALTRTMAAWVFQVSIAERFAGVPDHVMAALRDDLRLRVGLTPERTRRKGVSRVRECGKFNLAWARCRVVVLVLVRAHHTHQPAPLKPDHPWWPAELLAQDSPDVVPQLIAPSRKGLNTNKELQKALGAAANRVLCPLHELEPLRALLRDNAAPPELRAAHLISEEAAAAYAREDWMAFLEARRRSLYEAELAFLAELGITELDYPYGPETPW